MWRDGKCDGWAEKLVWVMGSILRSGDREAKVLLCVNVGTDNLPCLMFAEWRQSCVTMVALVFHSLNLNSASCGTIGSMPLHHCHRERFLPVTSGPRLTPASILYVVQVMGLI